MKDYDELLEKIANQKFYFYDMDGNILAEMGDKSKFHIFPKYLEKIHKSGERIVGRTCVGWLRFSTVFLNCVDSSLSPFPPSETRPPILYETMIFNDKNGDILGQWRWPAPRSFAKTMHREVVKSFSEGKLFDED